MIWKLFRCRNNLFKPRSVLFLEGISSGPSMETWESPGEELMNEEPPVPLATRRAQERLLSLPSHVHPQMGREIGISWAISGALRGTGRILIALC